MDEKVPALKLTRSQETELPQQVEIGFTDSETDYRRATVASRRLSGSSRREARADSPLITRRAEAQRHADAWLQDLWAAREGAEFELSHRRIDLEPGDVIALPTDAGDKLHRIVRIADGPTRKITSRAIEPAVFETPGSSIPRPTQTPTAGGGQTAGGRARSAGERWRSDAAAIHRGRGRSVAERRHDLAVRERRELHGASHSRSAGHHRRHDERARGRVRSGDSIRERSSMSRFHPARSAPSTTRRPSRAATCSPCGAPMAAGKFCRPPGRNSWASGAIGCRACCADCRAARRKRPAPFRRALSSCVSTKRWRRLRAISAISARPGVIASALPCSTTRTRLSWNSPRRSGAMRSARSLRCGSRPRGCRIT